MLERIVRRLNSRGTNRYISLISKPSKHSPSSSSSSSCTSHPTSPRSSCIRYKSRRMLHSAFWVHGGTGLDIPSLFFGSTDNYSNYNTADDEIPARQQQQQAAVVDLDFLYPPRALALIRRYSSARPSATALLIRYCRRLYSSSSAKEATAEDLQHHETLKNLARQSLPYDENIDIDQQYPTFDVLINSRKTDFYDLAWTLYHKELGYPWEKGDARSRRNTLLKYLSQSDNKVHLEQCIEIGSAITLEELGRYSCRCLVNVLIKLHNLPGALELLLAYASVHSRLHFCGVEDFLGYTLAKKEWNLMLKLWEGVMARKDHFSAILVLNSSNGAPAAFKEWLERTGGVIKTKRMEDFSNFIWKGALRSLATPKGEEFSTISYEMCQNITRLMEARGWVNDFDHVQKTILDCLNNQKYPEAFKLYETHRRQTNTLFYNELLNGLLKAYVHVKNFEGVRMIFEDFSNFGVKPDELSYGIVMKAFAARGETGVVDQLLKQYLDIYELNPHICRHVLRSRAMRGEMGAALEFLNAAESHGIEPDLLCYNTVMVGLSWARNMPAMLEILKRVLERGLKPNRVTYGALMYLCAFRGDVENTKFLMRLAELAGEVSFTMYNFLMMAHTKADNMAMAGKVLNYYESVSRDNSCHVWNTMLAGFAAKRWERSFNETLTRMKENGIEFDLHTYALHIYMFCRTRQYNEAVKVLESIPETLTMNNVPYNILIISLMKMRRYSEVWVLYEQMVQRNIQPSYATYTLLIQASILEARQNLGGNATSEDLVSRARAILHLVKTRRPGADLLSRYPIKSALPPSVFVPIMETLLQSGRPDEVPAEYKAFLELAEQQAPDGATPDRMILTPMLTASLRLGRWNAVRDSWRRLITYALKVGQKLPMENPNRTVLGYRGMMLAPQFSMLIDACVTAPDEMLPGGESPITLLDIREAKSTLESLGFVLDNKNWNDYVCCLAQFGELLEACRECEAHLMEGWVRRGRFSVATVTGAWKISKKEKVVFFTYSTTIKVLATEMVRLREQNIEEKSESRADRRKRMTEEFYTRKAVKSLGVADTNEVGNPLSYRPIIPVVSLAKRGPQPDKAKEDEKAEPTPLPPPEQEPPSDEEKEDEAEHTSSPESPPTETPTTAPEQSAAALLTRIRAECPLTFGACSVVPDVRNVADEQLQRRLQRKSRFQLWSADEPPTAEDMNPLDGAETERGTSLFPQKETTRKIAAERTEASIRPANGSKKRRNGGTI